MTVEDAQLQVLPACRRLSIRGVSPAPSLLTRTSDSQHFPVTQLGQKAKEGGCSSSIPCRLPCATAI
ncbi:unnamed protein product [Gadus morhua 'NCC']